MGKPRIGAARRATLDRPEGAVLSSRSPSGVHPVAHRAEIAQLVEHATENRGVASSILALGTTAPVRAAPERKWLSW